MTMKKSKTLQHIAAVAVVLLTLLVLAAPVSAESEITTWDQLRYAFNGGTVQLSSDIEVINPDSIDVYGTLDLNGKKLTIIYNEDQSFSAFQASDFFTIIDSVGCGELNLISTYDPINPWNTEIYIISAMSGARVTINGADTTTLNITSLSGESGMYVVNVASGATLTVTNGNIESSYIGIRAFLNSDDMMAEITIDGGSITASNTAIWIHQTSISQKNPYSLTVNDGSITSTVSGAAIGYWIRNNDKDPAIIRNTIISGGTLTSTTNGKYHYGVIGYENAYDDNGELGIDADQHLLHITNKVVLINKAGGDIIGLYNTTLSEPYFSYAYLDTKYEDGTHVTIKEAEVTDEGYVVTFTVPQNGKTYSWAIDNTVAETTTVPEYTHTFTQEPVATEHTVSALVSLSDMYTIGAYPLTVSVPAKENDDGTYTIVYHANNGSESGAVRYTNTFQPEEDGSFALTKFAEMNFVKDGYFFVGWNATSAAGEYLDYVDGEYFEGAADLFGEASSIELYAIWAQAKIEGVEIDATYDEETGVTSAIFSGVTTDDIVDTESDGYLVSKMYPANSTTITLNNGIQLTLVFNDEQSNNIFSSTPNSLNAPIANATVVYPWGNASLSGALAGSASHLVLFEMSNLTSIPTISGEFKTDVKSVIDSYLGSDAGLLAMISADGADNTNITNTAVIFQFYKHNVLTTAASFTGYHVKSDGTVLPLVLGESFLVADEGEYWVITLIGDGFSSYAVGYVDPASDEGGNGGTGGDGSDDDSGNAGGNTGGNTGGNAGTTTGGSGTGGGSSGGSTTVIPTVPPTEESTDDPTDVPGEQIPDVPVTPVTPEEPSTSAPVLAVLAALGAAVILRRK